MAQADRRAADERAQLIDITLWRVTKGDHIATARTRRPPVGLVFSDEDPAHPLRPFRPGGGTMADQDTKRAPQGPTSAGTRSTKPQGPAIDETAGNARDREMGREGPPLGDLGHGERTWMPPAGEQGISNRPDDAGTSGQRSSTMTQDVKKQGDGQKQGGQQSGQREGGGSQQGFAEQQSSQRRDEGDKDDQSPGRQREGQQGGGGQQGDSQTSGKSGGNKQGGSGGSQNKGDNDNKGGGQSGSKGSDRNV